MKIEGSVVGGIFVILLALLGCFGWVTNIVKLISTNTALAEWTILEVCRVIGIFVAPLGAVLGFF